MKISATISLIASSRFVIQMIWNSPFIGLILLVSCSNGQDQRDHKDIRKAEIDQKTNKTDSLHFSDFEQMVRYEDDLDSNLIQRFLLFKWPSYLPEGAEFRGHGVFEAKNYRLFYILQFSSSLRSSMLFTVDSKNKVLDQKFIVLTCPFCKNKEVQREILFKDDYLSKDSTNVFFEIWTFEQENPKEMPNMIEVEKNKTSEGWFVDGKGVFKQKTGSTKKQNISR